MDWSALRLGFLLLFLMGSSVESSLLITASSTQVNARVGSTVLLNVSITGAADPLLIWNMNSTPVVTWTMNSSAPPDISLYGNITLAPNGSLILRKVQLNFTSVYSAMVLKAGVGQSEVQINLRVYGSPACSVQASGSTALQYVCQWSDTPEAGLSFPSLNNSIVGHGVLSLTVPAVANLNGMQVVCYANSSAFPQTCNVTASSPANLQTSISTTVLNNGAVVVNISSNSPASPPPTVTWNGGNALNITGNQLILNNFNATQLGNYSCVATNPLGSVMTNVQLLAPTVSNFFMTTNNNGTAVTLNWASPENSIITGFYIQMMGPNLTTTSSSRRRKRATDNFRTVQFQPGGSRSTVLSGLNPQSTYWFRVVPVLGSTQGTPSQQYSVGQQTSSSGLSRAAIIGMAVGIPCGVLLIILLILLIVCCEKRRRRQNREPRYPVSRAVEKAVSVQPSLNAPHTLLTGGMKDDSPPSYNMQVSQTPTEHLRTLPSMGTPPSTRKATMV